MILVGKKSVLGSGAVARLSRWAYAMLTLAYSHDEPSLTVGLLPRYREVVLTACQYEFEI